MAGPQHLLAAPVRRLEQPDRLGHPAGGLVGEGEVAARPERLRVVRPQDPLAGLQGRLEQRDRLGLAAGAPIIRGEVVEPVQSVSGWSGPCTRSRARSVASCSESPSAFRPAML